MENSVKQRVAVITGASSGIGLEAAKTLVGQGWRVIGIGRNPQRCQRAEADIAACASGGGAIRMIQADLALLRETERAAAQIGDLTDRVDVLLNNAGGLTRDLTLTPEGLENTFASNHLGHFLLTDRLLPLLGNAAATAGRGVVRVVNVSSAAHQACESIDWDDLQMIHNFSSTPAYCRVKLANILFTRELARRLENDNIVVNAMHPGLVASNFSSHGDDAMQSYMSAKSDVAITPAEAADTLIWLAAAPEAGATSGGYFHNRQRIPTSELASDDEAARRLWVESERLVAGILASAAT